MSKTQTNQAVYTLQRNQYSRDNTHQFERENNDQNKIYIHIYRFMSAFYQVNFSLVHSSKDLFDSCLILMLLFFFSSSRYYNETLNMKVNNHGSISSFASQVV